MNCETEIKLIETTSTEVKNRLLGPEEMLRAIDTGALYVAGPGGVPQAMVTARSSGSGPAPGDSGIVDEVSVSGAAGIAASPLPEQAEKILHRLSATEINIITRPATGKPLMWGLTYNNYDSSAASGGTKCQWWRQKRLIELVDAVLYSSAAASATSGAGWGNVANL